MDKTVYDIAIVGGGPAGLTAALYAARGGAKTVLFESVFTGGQIVKSMHLDNYPGFPDGVEGFAFGAMLEKQAEKAGTEIRFAEVRSLSLDGDVKTMTFPDGTAEARAVILCTGASPKKLGIPGEEALAGAGVSYCATCDGPFFRNRKVAVVGGGDTAVSDALYLADVAEEVVLIHRRNELRAAEVLAKAAMRNPKIRFVWDSVPLQILGSDSVSGIRVRNVKTDAVSDIPVSAVFAAVGVVPQTALFADAVALNGYGAVKTDEQMRTSVPGVYAAGDVRETPLRQVVTACADGAVAAMTAISDLKKA